MAFSLKGTFIFLVVKTLTIRVNSVIKVSEELKIRSEESINVTCFLSEDLRSDKHRSVEGVIRESKPRVKEEVFASIVINENKRLKVTKQSKVKPLIAVSVLSKNF